MRYLITLITYKYLIISSTSMARAMVLWLRQMAHDQEVMGSNPGTVYWMGVSNVSYYTNIHEINQKKVAKWGKPKKNI
jgi:hypothetical protein